MLASKADAQPDAQPLNVKVSRLEQRRWGRRTDAGSSLLEGLAFGQVAIDVVTRSNHVAFVKEVVARRQPDRGRHVVAELELDFRHEPKQVPRITAFVP